MKKLLIIVAIVAAIVIGAPFYTGTRTQSEIENFANQLKEFLPNTDVSIVDYDKGLFSATGKLVFTNSEEPSWTDNPIVEIIKSSGEIDLVFDINTQDGLIITKPGFKFGLGHATFSVNSANNEILADIANATGLSAILTNDMFIDITGNTTNNLNVPSFTAEEGKISFGGITVAMTLDTDKRFDLQGSVGANNIDDEFISTPITFSAEGQLGTEEWPMPTGIVEVKAKSINVDNDGLASNVYFKGSISETNNLLSSTIKLTADKLTSPDEQTFSDVDYDIAISNIDKPSFQSMLNGELDGETAILKMLQASPRLTVNKIAAESSNSGELINLDLSGDFSINGEAIKTLTRMTDDINAVINAVSITFDSEFKANIEQEVTIEKSTIHIEMKDKTFDTQIALGAINIPDEGVKISPISISSKGAWKNSIWVVTEKSAMSVDSMVFADEALLKDLKINSHTTSNDDLMKSNAVFSLGQLTIQQPAIDLRDASLNLLFDNISESSITGIYDTVYNPDTMMKLMMGDEAVKADIETLVKKMVIADPVMSAKKLAFTLGQDTFDGNAKVKLDQSKLANVDSLIQDPSVFQSAVMADAKATFSQNLPLAITAIKAEDEYYYGLSDEEIKEEKQAQIDEVSAMLQQVVEQGYLTIDGDNYTIDAQYRDGQLTLNGQPIPLPF